MSPELFSMLVFLLSMIMGYMLDTKHIIHNRYFLSDGKIKEPISRISIFSAMIVIIRSAVSAVVALFVFSSRDQYLIVERSLLLVVMVLIVVIIGYLIEKLSKYDMVKVSYFYFPIILGSFFAVLGPDIAPIGWFEWLRAHSFGLPAEDLNQISDGIRQAAALLERSMATLLSPIFSDWIANVLARIFSMNTLFGYVITLYVSIFLFLGRAYRLKRVHSNEPIS